MIVPLDIVKVPELFTPNVSFPLRVIVPLFTPEAPPKTAIPCDFSSVTTTVPLFSRDPPPDASNPIDVFAPVSKVIVLNVLLIIEVPAPFACNTTLFPKPLFIVIFLSNVIFPLSDLKSTLFVAFAPKSRVWIWVPVKTIFPVWA